MNTTPRIKDNREVNLEDISIIGAYSLDEERNYRNDFSQLRYLKVPDLNQTIINLNEGGYIDTNKFYEMERMHQLEKFFMDNKDQVLMDNRIDADFVLFRGALKYIIKTAYRNVLWKCRAVKYKGTIYLNLLTYDYKETWKFKKNPWEYMFYQHGYKFEQYLLSSHPQQKPPGKSSPVNENKEFLTILSANIGGIKIIYGSKTDGVDSDTVIESLDDLKNAKLVEVRTQKGTRNNQAIDHWFQSYISGIDSAYIGYRNSIDMVDEIKGYSQETLKMEASEKQNFNKNVALNFFKRFLQQVQKDMAGFDNPNKINVYAWNSHTDDKVDLIETQDSGDFFTDEYISFMNNLGS